MEQAREYLSSLDNRTLTDLIEVYRLDFEMFQYSTEEYYFNNWLRIEELKNFNFISEDIDENNNPE